MKSLICALLSLFGAASPAAANGLAQRYTELHEDLVHVDEYGYKAHSNADSIPAEHENCIVQGALEITDNSLDFAVMGKGFFKLWDEKGGRIFYSRNGGFALDAEGCVIQSTTGYKLYPVLKCSRNMTGFAFEQPNVLRVMSRSEEVQRYAFELYMPKDVKDVQRSEGSCYAFSSAVRVDTTGGDGGRIMNGFLEMSTVSVQTTLIRMLFILERMRSTGMGIPGIETKIYLLKKTMEDYDAQMHEWRTAVMIMDMLQAEGAAQPDAARSAGIAGAREAMDGLRGIIARALPFLALDFSAESAGWL